MTSISIVIPVYNEEHKIINTIKSILKAINNVKIKNYELIIINDYSTDNTLKRISSLNKKNIKVINNDKNYGLGYSLKRGILNSKLEYISCFPGDDAHSYKDIEKLFKNIKNNDILIPVPDKSNKRSFIRNLISKIYTNLLNLIFLKKIHYYNGATIYKKKIIIKTINKVTSKSFFFLAELLLRSSKITARYKYVYYGVKKQNKTSAFNIKNLVFVIYDILATRLTI